VIKEFIQTFRNPRMRFVLLAPPLMQLVAYGYAFNLDISCIPTAVADFEQTQETREIVRRFERSGYFCVRARVARAADLGRLLDQGDVKLALQFDPGFTTDLRRNPPATLHARGRHRLNTAWSPPGTPTASRPLQPEIAQAAAAVPTTLGRAHGGDPVIVMAGIDLRPRAWYNPDLRSRNFFVPGVIALVTMLVSLQLTSMSIVREREVGTMEQLLVTPLRPAELILGKTIPPVLISFFDIALVTSVAVFWFQVPIRGSLVLLFGAAALYLLSTVGIGHISHRVVIPAAMMAMAFFMPANLFRLVSPPCPGPSSTCRSSTRCATSWSSSAGSFSRGSDSRSCGRRSSRSWFLEPCSSG
jgi:ABC-2 type transport system permease protein